MKHNLLSAHKDHLTQTAKGFELRLEQKYEILPQPSQHCGVVLASWNQGFLEQFSYRPPIDDIVSLLALAKIFH